MKENFPPLELPQTKIIQGKIYQGQLTVARPNIQSAAISELPSGLQRPSKTKSSPLHLTLPGASTEKQFSSIASFSAPSVH